ncbi:UNVERIFIED_CONTAM: hypothetical protein H355_009268 [Colinus virginianus]|nr:hypothetical protein H355_009268 [Colinus virginianus]
MLENTAFAFFYPGCQVQSLGLVFAVDASARVGLANFLQLRDFVKGSSWHCTINRDVTQIALVAYGSRAHTVFTLDAHSSNSALLQAIHQEFPEVILQDPQSSLQTPTCSSFQAVCSASQEPTSTPGGPETLTQMC